MKACLRLPRDADILQRVSDLGTLVVYAASQTDINDITRQLWARNPQTVNALDVDVPNVMAVTAVVERYHETVTSLNVRVSHCDRWNHFDM